MINLPELLQRLRFRWLERVVYTRIAKPFSLSVEEIPPLIPSVLSGDVIFDTEAEKKVFTLNLVQSLQVYNMYCVCRYI